MTRKSEPQSASSLGGGLDRRDFLKLLGAGAAAPVVGCTSKPVETLIPYVVEPEEITPGVATYYATVCQECPAGCGMLVRTREGRAVKVEGNPAHPLNRGGLCARGHASLQGLYNPDRFRGPFRRRPDGGLAPLSWTEAESLFAERVRQVRDNRAADRLAFLAGRLPDSLYDLTARWLAALGSERLLTYEPFGDEALRQAGRVCFDRATVPTSDLAATRFLIGFGADFLDTWHSPTHYAEAFGRMRRTAAPPDGGFVQVESRMSLTGANADEWIAVAPGREAFLALGMARRLLPDSAVPDGERNGLARLLAPYAAERVAALTDVSVATQERLARAFARHRPSLALAGGVAAGSRQATELAIAVHLLNYVAGNVGHTVRFDEAASRQPGSYAGLLSLVDDMAAGRVPLLMLAHTNPAFSLPRTAGFVEALAKVPFVVSFSSFPDETTEHADLILPDHTPLESWGDVRPAADVAGLMQPVMQPVFETQAVGDTLLSVGRRLAPELADALPWQNYFDYVQTAWRDRHEREGLEGDFDAWWRKALQTGGIWSDGEAQDPALPASGGRRNRVRLASAVFETRFEEPALDGADDDALTFIAYPSSRYYDGRGANKPWLHELPDPLTQVVWNSWLEIHPDTAARLGIEEGDLLRVTSPHGSLEASAYLYPGLRRDAVAMPIGLGHTHYGRYARGRGANPVHLLSARPEAASGGFAWLSTKVRLTQTGRRVPLATTDGSRRQLGRGIAQAVDANRTEPAAQADGHAEPGHTSDMYPEPTYETYRWGMSIDLSACTGCGACVTACSAENNVPVVGERAVAQGREAAWLRIERYFEEVGPAGQSAEMPDAPEVRFAPMLCQHCGNAPCEPVCPVYATYHNPEGLNAQIYNRCVGTRYCANNCPYKVRRFNWNPADWPAPLHLQLNPDVTVREPGVMEKCSFCVQRIQEAKDRAKDAGRPVRDGEVTPACAQTCPAHAITFGNLKDPDSRVARAAHDVRGYRVFDTLNTKPAVIYLKKVRRGPV